MMKRIAALTMVRNDATERVATRIKYSRCFETEKAI